MIAFFNRYFKAKYSLNPSAVFYYLSDIVKTTPNQKEDLPVMKKNFEKRHLTVEELSINNVRLKRIKRDESNSNIFGNWVEKGSRIY